jgi:ribonuclease E/ribonuclease G
MSIEIVAQKIDNQLHAAVLKGGSVTDLYVDSKEAFPLWGSIYLGTVDKIDKALDVAFINIGGNQQGILPLKHIYKAGLDSRTEKITSLLNPGETVIVQVKAEGRHKTPFENRKLPRLTMKLYLPGRLLSYSPTANKVTVSRQVSNEDVFRIAQELKTQGGWIIRSAAENADPLALEAEAKILRALWATLQDMRRDKPGTPRLLHKGPNAVCRALIDYASQAVNRIEMTENSQPDSVRKWCDDHIPDLGDRLIISPEHKVDLFEMHDIHQIIEEALERYVPLPHGGSLIIEETHAMTVVDLNRGDGGDIKTVNLEAAKEIVRQLRIRNISGALLVDFISMRLRSDRYDLISNLEKMLEDDPGNTQVHGFTRLGIMEITRTRRTGCLLEKYKS